MIFAHRLGYVFGLMAVVLMLAAAPTPSAAQTYTFSAIRVEGNERIEEATILSFAGIARNKPVSAAEVNDAYQRVLASDLFENVSLEPRGNTLVINVTEYPTINRINFEGNNRLNDDALRGLISSRERRVYSPSRAEADVAAITDAYFQTGRIAATVEPRLIQRSENRVDLVFEIAEGSTAEIERLDFQGNDVYSDRRLRRVLETKQAGLLRRLFQSDTFIPDRVEFDKQLLRDFYTSRGYVDFQVLSTTAQLTRERDGFFLTFTVREGQRFRFGEITTSSNLPEIDVAEFQDVLRLRSGDVYSPTRIEDNVTRMENLALQKGLTFIRVEPRVTRNDRDLTLDVEFVVERGPRVFVERIDIEGNTETLDRVIRRQFRAVEGDPFNPREIRAAAARIRALGFFSNAEVNTEPGSTDDQVLVDVNVTEQPTGSLTFGVSFSLQTGPGFIVSFSERNFLGRGQFFSLTIDTSSSNSSSSFVFREPAFLGRDLRFGLDARFVLTDSGDDFNTTYDTRTLSFSPSIGFPVSENGRLLLRATLADEKVTDVNNDASFLIKKDEGSLTTTSIGYEYSFDTRTTGLDTNAGIRFEFRQDVAGLVGGNEFLRTTALLSAERRIRNEEIVLRAELEGGMLNQLGGDSRIIDRFFARGKIRGFEPNGIGPRDFNVPEEDALGGNLFAVARFETEFPLGLPEELGINGGLFLDVGSVWSLDDVNGGPTGTDRVDDGFEIRSAVGFSIFWTSALGPLRFNFSRPMKKQSGDLTQNFDFTISTQF
jgi:outer membrane protein insertion porin family